MLEFLTQKMHKCHASQIYEGGLGNFTEHKFQNSVRPFTEGAMAVFGLEA